MRSKLEFPSATSKSPAAENNIQLATRALKNDKYQFFTLKNLTTKLEISNHLSMKMKMQYL